MHLGACTITDKAHKHTQPPPLKKGGCNLQAAPCGSLALSLPVGVAIALAEAVLLE